MPDDDSVPSSLGGSVMSGPVASAPRPATRRRVRILTGIAIVLALGTVAFGVMGFVRESSLDLPLPDHVRLGFHENGWPHRWTCPQQHDHWSAPYWSGTLALAVISYLIGRRAWTRARGGMFPAS